VISVVEISLILVDSKPEYLRLELGSVYQEQVVSLVQVQLPNTKAVLRVISKLKCFC
jgi:hypothetical protein